MNAIVVSKLRRKKKMKKSFQVVFGGRTERYTYTRHFHEQKVTSNGILRRFKHGSSYQKHGIQKKTATEYHN